MPTDLQFQCPACGSYDLTVCELRKVWYNCTPKFDLQDEFNYISPCYDLEDNLCNWADGEHYSTHKFACAKCHRSWDNVQEMYKDEALIELKPKPEPKAIRFCCPKCNCETLRRRYAAFEIYELDVLELRECKGKPYIRIETGSKVDTAQAQENPAEPDGLICAGCHTHYTKEEILDKHLYKHVNY